MKALSLSIIKGFVDQVDSVVHVDWVQPRVLDKVQLESMRSRLDAWCSKVEEVAVVMSTETPELFVQ